MSYVPAHKLDGFPVYPFVQRSVINPAQPKPPTSGMSQAVDDEAKTAFTNIKRNIEPWI